MYRPFSAQLSEPTQHARREATQADRQRLAILCRRRQPVSVGQPTNESRAVSCLSSCLFVCPSVCSVCLPVCPSVCPRRIPVTATVRPSAAAAALPACPSARLSVCRLCTCPPPRVCPPARPGRARSNRCQSALNANRWPRPALTARAWLTPAADRQRGNGETGAMGIWGKQASGGNGIGNGHVEKTGNWGTGPLGSE